MRSDILEQAQTIRISMNKVGAMITDEQAVTVVCIYEKWSGNGIEYTKDTRIQYNGNLYKCITTHTSQETWNPEDAASLWTKILIPDPGVIPEWEQPSSTNPYMKDDKVSHNGKIWRSLIDNNVWEPGVVGTESLWEEVV